MEKRVRSKEELMEDKDRLVELYYSKQRSSKKVQLLTKKEKKILGIDKDLGKATVKYVRISARKVKIVLDLIKGKGIDEAYGIIRYTPKAASELLYKLMKSAEANAVNNNGLDRDSLYVADVYADQGPTLKRMMPRARGSANRILKRTSHITLVLKERKA